MQSLAHARFFDLQRLMGFVQSLVVVLVLLACDLQVLIPVFAVVLVVLLGANNAVSSLSYQAGIWRNQQGQLMVCVALSAEGVVLKPLLGRGAFFNILLGAKRFRPLDWSELCCRAQFGGGPKQWVLNP